MSQGVAGGRGHRGGRTGKGALGSRMNIGLTKAFWWVLGGFWCLLFRLPDDAVVLIPNGDMVVVVVMVVVWCWGVRAGFCTTWSGLANQTHLCSGVQAGMCSVFGLREAGGCLEILGGWVSKHPPPPWWWCGVFWCMGADGFTAGMY